MTKSVEGLKIGGMYFLPKTFATELINKNCAAEVISIEPLEDHPVEQIGMATVIAGPSRNKVVQPSQRKKN